MSATGRGQRNGGPDDFFKTPAWCVDRLLEVREFPGGSWLEPAAGDGAIIRAVNAHPSSPRSLTWHAHDIRPECKPHLDTLAQNDIGDFLALRQWETRRYAVCVTNPPFGLAEAFLRRCLEVADTVVFLQRLPWLASDDRADLFRALPPDVYVLPDRPSFVNIRKRVRDPKTGKLKWQVTTTDATDYCWFCWGTDRTRISGSVRVLASTPLETRVAQRPPQVVLGTEDRAWDEPEVAA